MILFRVAVVGLLAAPSVLAVDFSPKDIPGLELWVEADSGVTANPAGQVERWADQSDQGNDFVSQTAELRPLLAENSAHGRAALRFDGRDDEMRLTRPIRPAGKSVFAVVKWDQPKTYSFAIGYDAGTDGYLRMAGEYRLLTGGLYPGICQDMVYLPKTAPPSYDRKIFHDMPMSLLDFHVYGVTENPEGKELIKWLGRNELNNVPENRFAGQIAAVLVYSRCLAAGEQRQIEQYLGEKYCSWPPVTRVPLIDVVGKSPAATPTAGEPREVDLGAAPAGIVFHGLLDQPLAAGRYRLHLEAAGDLSSSPDRRVILWAGHQVLTLPACRPQPSARFEPIAVDFEVPRANGDGPVFGDTKIRTVPPLRSVIRMTWRPAPVQGKAADSSPRTSRKQTVAVRDLYVQRLFPVKVTHLRTDKVCYRPGEDAVVELRLMNTAAETQRLDARFYEVTELDDRRPLGLRPVEFVPGEEAVVRLDFTPGPVEYGRDLLLELVQGGAVCETAREPFGVADNVWKICIGANPGGPAGSSADATGEAIVKQIEGFRRQYCNVWEKYFWAPDDWADLTPPAGATWYSCQARRHENTEKIQLQVAESHRRGIAVVTYGKCMAGGNHGWDLARRRPQWFVTDVYGRTMGRPASVWDLEHWQEGDKYAYADYRYVWTYRWVDLRRLEPLDHGIDELIASARQFGWDGVRYDSGGFRAHWVDGLYDGNDAVNTRNMKRTKERIWQSHPGFLFGFNTANCTSPDGRAYPLRVEHMSHEMREMLAGGGLWMGEAIKDFSNGRITYATWSQFAREEGRCIRAIKEAGGHFCYLYRTASPVRNVYQFVLGVILGAHPYGGEHVGLPGCDDWGALLTRWSGLVWDHRLRPLKGEELAVTASRPVWWKDFANQRVVAPDRRHLIVHLLNPPLEDQIAKAGAEFPPPITDAVVRYRAPAGEELVQVRFITPAKPSRSLALQAAMSDAVAEIAVPEFDTWAMVVFELRGAFQVPAQGPRMSEPLSEHEATELRRTEPKPVEKLPWFGLRPPAVTANVAIGDSLDPAPQIDQSLLELRKLASQVRPPDGFAVGGEAGIDALVATGFYHELYDVLGAVKAADNAARVRRCPWVRDPKGRGHLQKLPASYEELAGYDVVVLVDMGADEFDADGLKRLADYVRAGGRLVIVGGPFTLGQGHFKGSPLEDVLPVEVRAGRDVYQLPHPLAIGVARAEPLPTRPLVYYYHAARPKPAAMVQLWAGDLPIMLQHRVGKGSCAVLLATVLGEPTADGQTPFWQDKAWPAVFGRCVLGGQ